MVKVEAEDTVGSLEDYDLVILMLGWHISRLCCQPPLVTLTVVHASIKLIETPVQQILIINQVPLSPGNVSKLNLNHHHIAVSSVPGIVITFSVAHSRKVQPLGVTKLISNEVEISLSRQTMHQQSDHLVKRHSSEHDDLCIIDLNNYYLETVVDIGKRELMPVYI